MVRTGVAYKRGEKRTGKVKEQKQKQKRSIKRRKRREKEKREKERHTEQDRKCHRSLLKRRSIKKTEARPKQIAMKYQIEGSKRMKTNKK